MRAHWSLSPAVLPFAAATVVGSLMITLSVLVLPSEPPPSRSPASPSPSESAASTGLAALPAGDELVIASGEDLSGRARGEAIAEWNALHPTIPARVRTVPGNTDRQRAGFRSLLGSDDVDVVNLDSAHLAEFADAPADAEGLLAPLEAGSPGVGAGISDGDLSDFVHNAILTCFWHDRLYGLPFNTDVGLLFFHADSTPPPTWDALMSSLSKSSTKLALQLGRDEAFVVGVLEQLLAVDPTLLNADGTPPTVVQEKWEKALVPLRRAVQAGLVFSPEADNGRTAEENTARAFDNDEVAVMRNWPVWFGAVQPQPKVRKLYGPGVLGGQNLVISARSRHKPQALELIKFLTGAEIQRKLLINGRFVPTRTSTYTSTEVAAKIPYVDVLLSAVNEARPRPISPNYFKASSIIIDDLRPAVMNGAPVPDTFERSLQDALN